MPRTPQPKGVCAGCKTVLDRMAMQRHLDQCEKLTGKKTPRGSAAVERARLTIDTPYPSPYWMIMDAHPNAKLEDLDEFLREEWLECCGHLSAFHIGQQGYALQPMEEFGDRGLDVRITDAIPQGTTARYEYDFGSTTELRVRAGVSASGPSGGGRIRLLAQNEAPVFPCEVCKKPATVICATCKNEGEGDGARCAECRTKGHECEDNMWFDILNSPRLATCGYGGNW